MNDSIGYPALRVSHFNVVLHMIIQQTVLRTVELCVGVHAFHRNSNSCFQLSHTHTLLLVLLLTLYKGCHGDVSNVVYGEKHFQPQTPNFVPHNIK